MLSEALSELFERDLRRLKGEISAFKDESAIWHTSGAVSNSPGNLVLHLVGNLNHYIGAVLGDSGYIRKREAEFARKHVARQTLLEQIDVTRQVVLKTLAGIPDDDLAKTYPLEVLGKTDMSTGFFLCHLSTHLNYHLGQVNYHRRLVD
jgi:uncharacterized damage-inducible protein DinB